MNDSELAEGLIAAFLGDIPTSIEAIAASLDAADIAEAGRIAHRIKGAAMSMSAEALSGTALAIETLGRESRLEEARALLPELLSRFAELRLVLEAAKF